MGHSENLPESGAARSSVSEPIRYSFIIVSWNTRDLTRRSILSVLRQMPHSSSEIIVVDNASADGTAGMVRTEFPHVCLIVNPTNVGFGAANNQGMRVARGRFFFLLNSDAELLGSVEPCAAYMDRSGLGLAGCRLRLPDGRIQESCRRFPSLGIFLLEGLFLYKLIPPVWRSHLLLGGYWAHDHAQRVDWVNATAVMVRREVFEETAGFDERIFMYGEDMEWCMRIQDAGWSIGYYPDVEVRHRAHTSGNLGFGQSRFDLCQARLFQVMQRRKGKIYAVGLFMISFLATCLRTLYFRVRRLVFGSRGPHLEDRLGYYRRALGFHVRVLRLGWSDEAMVGSIMGRVMQEGALATGNERSGESSGAVGNATRE